MRQLPPLLWRKSRAASDIPALTPPIYVLFSTEEEHRASREADVVPPIVCRNIVADIHDVSQRDMRLLLTSATRLAGTVADSRSRG